MTKDIKTLEKEKDDIIGEMNSLIREEENIASMISWDQIRSAMMTFRKHLSAQGIVGSDKNNIVLQSDETFARLQKTNLTDKYYMMRHGLGRTQKDFNARFKYKVERCEVLLAHIMAFHDYGDTDFNTAHTMLKENSSKRRALSAKLKAIQAEIKEYHVCSETFQKKAMEALRKYNQQFTEDYNRKNGTAFSPMQLGFY